MIEIRVNNRYSEAFIKKRCIPIIIKIITENMSNKKYNPIQEYIENEYNISKNDIINAIKKGLIVLNDDNSKSFIITFDSNLKVNDKLSLDQLIRLYDYGNREIKGTKIFLDSFAFAKKSIKSLYLFSIMGGNNKIWQ